jgi:hypothetical protein
VFPDFRNFAGRCGIIQGLPGTPGISLRRRMSMKTLPGAVAMTLTCLGLAAPAGADTFPVKQGDWEVTFRYSPTYKEGELSDLGVTFRYARPLNPGFAYRVTVRLYESDWANPDDPIACEWHDPKCGSCKGAACTKRETRKGWDFSFIGNDTGTTVIAGTVDVKVDWKKYANLGKAKVYARITADETRKLDDTGFGVKLQKIPPFVNDQDGKRVVIVKAK